MAVFLSDAWIAAVEAALRDATALRDLPGLSLEQVVRDVPDRGEVRYRIVVGSPSADPPIVRFTTDYATAVALSQGRTNAQAALATGRLRLGGAVDVLMARAEAFAALDDILAAVRAHTTYP